MVIVSLISILVIGSLDWRWARTTFQENTLNHLTSVRTAKADEIESYFTSLRHQIESLCEDQRVVEAMQGLEQAYHHLEQQELAPEIRPALRHYYEESFFPQLASTVAGEPSFATYVPDSSAAQYLQYQYIVKNPNPIAAKAELDQAEDASAYSEIHGRYHPLFRQVVEQFGYDDLFLIDYENGQIVYSVAKETDYGTSLSVGPYRESNLAKVVQTVRENPDRGAIQIVDFAPYRPSYLKPAAFFAGPIYDGPHLVGILGVQISGAEINRILTGNQNWQAEGLGSSGETYGVGADRRMRSLSRFLLEDPQGYVAALQKMGTPASTIETIQQFQTTVLRQPVRLEAVKAAISGSSGTGTELDYRGVPVLLSYGPLQIQGLDWAIVAQKDAAEVYQPVQTLKTSMFVATVALVLVVTLIGNLAAYSFMKPINLLMEVAQDHEIDEVEREILMQSKDEFSEIASILVGMSEAIQHQESLVAKRDHAVEQLLSYLLPRRVASQLKQDEAPILEKISTIADEVQNVSVMVVSWVGLAQLASNQPVQEVASQLNQLVDSFDALAQRGDLERLSIIGDRYIAVCGLTKPHLDHEKRIVDFALQALNVVQGFNNRYNTDLKIRIGIHSGMVMAGIIGTQKLSYNLWGETVTIATQLSSQGIDNTILITEVVHDRLQDLYTFVPAETLNVETMTVKTWRLGGR